MNEDDRVTVHGVVSRKVRFSDNISHVDLVTKDGLLIVETGHATADEVSGTIKIERACRFLVGAGLFTLAGEVIE